MHIIGGIRVKDRKRLILVLMLGLIALTVVAESFTYVLDSRPGTESEEYFVQMERANPPFELDMVADGADELSRVVSAKEVLSKIEVNTSANFDNCIIVGDLNLSAMKINEPVRFNHTVFQNSVRFDSTTFNSSVDFEYASFNGIIDFDSSKFNSTADFTSSKFNDTADFRNAIFEGVDFKDAKFNSTADFTSSKFNGIADFEYASFNGTAYFSSSKFNDLATFLWSKFNSYACFSDAKFNDAAIFQDSEFNLSGEFRNSIFNDYTNFGWSKFNNDADFWNSTFNHTVYIQGSTFSNNAYFEKSTFNDIVHFDGSTFKDNAFFNISKFNSIASFHGSKFNNNTNFNNVIFQKEIQFSDCQFKGNTFFNNSKFKEDAFFEGADFNSTLYLTRAKYVNLYIRWHDIKNLAFDDVAYLSLMENFKKLGYIEDYDNCYFKYRKERRSQDWSGKYNAMSPTEEKIRKIADLGLEVFYGYGKRPLNPLGWSLFFIGFFAVIWRIMGLDAPLRFSFRAFLSGTKLFVDPPKIPEQIKSSRPLLEDVLTVEMVLGALFSVLFFLAIGATIVR